MIIARQKRKENIAEYLLYMWQVEDLIRANKFDMDSINRTVIAHYDQPEEVKKEIAQWYEELIDTIIVFLCKRFILVVNYFLFSLLDYKTLLF